MCLAIPGRIIEVVEDESLRRGKVDFGGVRKEVCLAFTPDAVPGDYVLVHVGFAISVVDEVEAQRVFEYLRQMGEAGEISG
jgi:hydrogenase expression/formation protein HypC